MGKSMYNNRFLDNYNKSENEYTVNGVKYIVSSCFAPISIAKGIRSETFSDRISEFIKSDFVDLIDVSPHDKMANEYVCSTAGKED